MRKLPTALGALLWLTGCAQVGPVQPPSPGLPPVVHDLTAVRRGPTIEVAFTPAAGAAGYQACLWPGVVEPPAAVTPPHPLVAAVPDDVPPPPPPPPGPRAAMLLPDGRTMPPCPQLVPLAARSLPTPPGNGLLTLAVAAFNVRGLTAGWSNPVLVPLGAVAPPPQLSSAAATPQGVSLQWQLPQPPPAAIEVFRQLGTQAPQRLTQLAGHSSAYLDAATAPGNQYAYWLRSARPDGTQLIESADSTHRVVDTTDVFPPPVPQGLQAVAAPNGGVDLSWNTVTALDLAGYNVYRRAAGGAWSKLNPAPLPTPVFHDPDPPAGAGYAVTSVDVLGNESTRSSTAAIQ